MISNIMKNVKDNLSVINDIVNIKDLSYQLIEFDQEISKDSFWNDNAKAQKTLKKRQDISKLIDEVTTANSQLSFYEEVYQTEPSLLEEDIKTLLQFEDKLSKMKFSLILKGEADNVPAIITITSGAGGNESANWVSMLLRMYARWAAQNGFSVEIIDLKKSKEYEDKCIDTVSIRVSGDFAYGFLKSENGVHRLIRNSPFNANDARHTSFAAVYVTPDVEDTIDIQIRDEDLELTFCRSGGKGGQNQNKVESAVRIKHMPTGVVVNCRTERDQHANRKIAMKMLKSKLYEIELNKKEAEKEKALSTLQDNTFGSQIRTYTLDPYKLVKDERTDCQSRDALAVLDGDINDFIYSYLNYNIKK